MCVVILYPPLELHQRRGRTNVVAEAGSMALRVQSSAREQGEGGEENVYIRDREGLSACPPLAGRGGVCEYVAPGIGRGGVIPSEIVAIAFLCGVLFGSYKPGTLAACSMKTNGWVGRTGWSYRSNSF